MIDEIQNIAEDFEGMKETPKLRLNNLSHLKIAHYWSKCDCVCISFSSITSIILLLLLKQIELCRVNANQKRHSRTVICPPTAAPAVGHSMLGGNTEQTRGFLSFFQKQINITHKYMRKY